MEFRLTFPLQHYAAKISYRQKIILAGSCFAQNMGDLMGQYKLNTSTNPNGIVYNPISIAAQINRLLTGAAYTEEELFFYNELWGSWQHHGQFSHPHKTTALQNINNSFTAAQNNLHTGDWLILTFGSAYVYTLNSSGQAVANCHKYPNHQFTKELVSVDSIVNTWQTLITQLKAKNPKLNILLTVSPVRYVRDGLVNNTLSKAILLQAVHHLCNEFEYINYFPAYELVMDDLRDYRFFTEDLVHPNAQAIHYVWQNFTQALFDDEAKAIFAKLQPIVVAAQHRVLHKETTAHQKFIAAHQKKLQSLKTEYPFLELQDLEQVFYKQ